MFVISYFLCHTHFFLPPILRRYGDGEKMKRISPSSDLKFKVGEKVAENRAKSCDFYSFLPEMVGFFSVDICLQRGWEKKVC